MSSVVESQSTGRPWPRGVGCVGGVGVTQAMTSLVAPSPPRPTDDASPDKHKGHPYLRSLLHLFHSDRFTYFPANITQIRNQYYNSLKNYTGIKDYINMKYDGHIANGEAF